MKIKTRIVLSFSLILALVLGLSSIVQNSYLKILENNRVGVEEATPTLLTVMALSSVVSKKELSLSLIDESSSISEIEQHREQDALLDQEIARVLDQFEQLTINDQNEAYLENVRDAIAILVELGKARFDTHAAVILHTDNAAQGEAGYLQAEFDLVDNIKTVRQDVFGIEQAISQYNGMIAAVGQIKKSLNELRFSQATDTLVQLKPQLATHKKALQDYLTQLEVLDDVSMFSIEQMQDYLSVYGEVIQAETGYPQSVLAQVEMTHQSRAELQQISEQSAEIQAALKSLKDSAKKYFDQTSYHTQKVISGSQWALWLSFSGLVALSLLAVSMLIQRLMRPLTNLMADVNQLSQGDLTTHVDIQTQDEFQILGDTVNGMISEWNTLIGQSQLACTALAQTAAASKDLSRQSKDKFNHQQEYIEQVATTAEELSATVREIAKSSQDSLSYTNQAGQLVEEGKSQVTQVTQSILGLSQELDKNVTELNTLNEEVGNISKILDVIRGIAEQTNLLALNAAIEAARAGEQGRGFAVVADEVRSLADRTRHSTIEIDTMIKSLQSGAHSAMVGIKTATDNANDATASAQQINGSFNEIASAMDQVCQAAILVANASEEQSVATDEVTRNIVEIKQSAYDTLEHTELNYEKSETVFTSADSLLARMNKFTTK